MVYSKVYIIEISSSPGRGFEWDFGFDLRWVGGWVADGVFFVLYSRDVLCEYGS
jgi:hypothetical protein